jgi:hypothetical protein
VNLRAIRIKNYDVLPQNPTDGKQRVPRFRGVEIFLVESLKSSGLDPLFAEYRDHLSRLQCTDLLFGLRSANRWVSQKTGIRRPRISWEKLEFRPGSLPSKTAPKLFNIAGRNISFLQQTGGGTVIRERSERGRCALILLLGVFSSLSKGHELAQGGLR